jgi:hypothetical protein
VVRIIIADPSSPAVGGFDDNRGGREKAVSNAGDRRRACEVAVLPNAPLVGYEVCEGLSTISAGTNACASFRTKLLLPALKVGSE